MNVQLELGFFHNRTGKAKRVRRGTLQNEGREKWVVSAPFFKTPVIGKARFPLKVNSQSYRPKQQK
jgi:hypothetical protein